MITVPWNTPITEVGLPGTVQVSLSNGELANLPVTWNITGYWENEDYSARVSLNHRSPYVQDSTDAFFAREGRTVEGRNQIDVLLGWNISEQWSVRFGALNLNGKDEEAYRDELTRAWQTTSVIGRSYYLGVNFSL